MHLCYGSSDWVQGPIPLPTSCGMWAWQLTGQQPKGLQGRGPRPAPDSGLKTQDTIKGTAWAEQGECGFMQGLGEEVVAQRLWHKIELRGGVRWCLTREALKTAFMAFNINTATSQLCSLEQVTSHLCVSISSCVKWDDIRYIYFRGIS